MPGLRWQSYLRWDLMDELREGVKQYGIEVFYNSPTVSRDDSKCENEHSYEGHESGAPLHISYRRRGRRQGCREGREEGRGEGQ